MSRLPLLVAAGQQHCQHLLLLLMPPTHPVLPPPLPVRHVLPLLLLMMPQLQCLRQLRG
jgi:hypothetical protein